MSTMRFKMVSGGNHGHGGRVYHVGDEIETEIDLEMKFNTPGSVKFVRVPVPVPVPVLETNNEESEESIQTNEGSDSLAGGESELNAEDSIRSSSGSGSKRKRN